jgi:hypothetical protein
MDRFRDFGAQAVKFEQVGQDKWPGLLSSLNTTSDEAATLPLQSTLAFLARSWWSRIWVVQEVASARIVRFYCGHQIISEYAMYVSVLLFTFARDAAVR